MKKTILTLTAFAITFVAIGQKTSFCAKDKTIHKVENETRNDAFEVKHTAKYSDYKYNQYLISLSAAQQKNARIILDKHSNTPSGDFVKIGSIPCDELRAPTTVVDKLKAGLYHEAATFEGSIEVWSNGDEVFFQFPIIKDVVNESKSHKIYVPKECIAEMITNFKK